MNERLHHFGSWIRGAVPILTWVPQYQREWLRPDTIAGVTSWSLMVPVSIAYAGLAGVPAEYGLYTAFAALALYAIFGTSRHLKVTASSTMAVMSAAVVAPMAGGDAALYLSLTAALAFVVGLYLVGAGILKLGFIADFLSKSVVTGFVIGLALNIAIGQLPKIFGVPAGEGNFFQQTYQLIQNLPEADPLTTIIGLGTLFFVLYMRHRNRLFPAGLVAVGVGIALVWLLADKLQLEQFNVSTVGVIPTGLPEVAMPRPGLFNLPFLLSSALGIVFLAVGESLGAARAFASKNGYAVDANQELVALGAANLGSSLVGGFSVDASLSATATAAEGGTKTQLSSLVTSGLVLLTAAFLAPLFRNLPDAVLGGIVTASVIGLMDIPELRRFLSTSRTDFVLAMVAMFGVLFSDVLTGLMIAVSLSLILVLYRASRPEVVPLGRVPGQPGSFGNRERHPEFEQVAGLAIFRVDSPLYFFNTNTVFDQIQNSLKAMEPPPEAVLLDIGASSDLDISSMDALREFLGKVRGMGISVGLTQIRGPVRDRLRQSQLMDEIGAGNIYLSVEAGVQGYFAQQAAAEAAAAEAAAAEAAAAEAAAAEATATTAADAATAENVDDEPSPPTAPDAPQP
jgi:high affinity sulfate transporter 1